MRQTLLASTCLIAFIATAAAAETNIDTATTNPIRTATVKSGAPDNVKITTKGSVKPTGGTAVIIDSNNQVVNEGTIEIGNANNATGIFAQAGITGMITNAAGGKIIIDEPYTPTDIDNDGDLDGVFAIGSGRAGISTGGAFTGNIINSGTITIEGNDSAGIRLGGALTGKLTHDGMTTVLGDRALGVGLRDVTGNVRLAGTISATGLDAVAAQLTGTIAGALEVQGNLTATGYRSTTSPADPSKLDADDLLLGGPALSIEGDVTGGVILAVPPKDNSTTDADEDDDGIDDAKEGSAVVRSYGSAPAMRIGAVDHSVTIGPVSGTGTGFGLVINGSVIGSGVYAGKNASALDIGGRGGAVNIAGGIGIGIGGNVQAASNGASATAIRIGAGATTPEIRNAGKVEATGGNAATAIASAIQIDAGGNVATIRNSGAIIAKASGDAGTAVAIIDKSGSVSLIENSGSISATGALAASGRNIALDLSVNVGGVMLKQTAVASGITAPTIIGDVRMGGGDDIFDIADGSVKGNTSFGAGANQLKLSGDAIYNGNAIFGAANDSLALAGTSIFNGMADFGGGADMLTIGGSSLFTGTLANSQGLAVTVDGGTFDVSGAATISSLAVTGKGVLGVTLDAGSSGTALSVTGNASFADQSKLALKLSSVEDAEGSHVVLQAGSLSGADKLTTTTTLLPFLYKGVLTSNATQLIIDVSRKSATELALNRSETSAFGAIYSALTADADVEAAFLDIADGDRFRQQVGQMLPEHEGGVFEVVTSGSRALSRHLADPTSPFKDEGKWGYWISQAAWGSSKGLGNTASYDVTGWGISGGGEIETGLGNFGLSAGFLSGKDGNGSNANEVNSSQWEGAAYWRLHSGDWMANARFSGAPISLKGTRLFHADNGATSIDKVANGSWDATLWSASASVSHDSRFGLLSFRPSLAVDYYKLKEDGYTEVGGGDAFNLIVADRSSDETTVSGLVALGLDLGGLDEYDGWIRFELEGGRREIVGGSLGNTVAQYKDGTPFTLVPEKRTSGWVGRVRGIAGNPTFQVAGEFSAEEQQSHVALAFRASLRIGL